MSFVPPRGPRAPGVIPACLLLGAVVLSAPGLCAQKAPGLVRSYVRISEGDGGFTDTLDFGEEFGMAIAPLGDFDGDGVPDMVVSTAHDSDGGMTRGAIHLLYMNTDGTVKDRRKISDLEGGFDYPLQNGDHFGESIAPLGDIDGDGVIDLAVGAKRVAGSQPAEGAVFILFLNADGTAKDYILINEGNGGFTGLLTNGDEFGSAVACIGDVDGDGVDDLAVGAQFDNDGGPDRGSVWILFMNPDGTVRAQTRLSDTVGGNMPDLDDEDQFGHDIAALGDLDGDGFVDIAVGAGGDDYQGFERGAVHILYLDAAGQAKSYVTINNASPNFTWWLADQDRFGMGLAYLRDIDGDGYRDLAVGNQRDDDGGINRGSVYLLSLRPDASINNMLKISPVVGGFDGPTTDDDRFGLSVGVVGDLDGDGQHELVVGAPTGTDDGEQVGITWVLFLHQADEISLVPGQQDVPQGPPGGPGPGVQPPAPLPPGIGDIVEQVYGHRLRGWPFSRR